MNAPLLRTVRIVFAGGGTGGHLYPAIAIADRISELLKGQMTVEIIFVGTKRGLEYRIQESLGYPLHLINVRGLARSFTLKNLLVPFNLIGSLLKARTLLRKFSPQIVVGTGGYVSLPVLRMAAAQGIITVIQEQNSFPGIATRKIAPHAQRIYLGFSKAAEYFKTDAKVIETGNPVRRSISKGDRLEAIRYFKLDPNKKTILVIGGSQGALAINQAVLGSLNQRALPDGYQLLWQTGKRDYKEVIATAGDKAFGHSLFPFENRMDLVYAAADIAISRAGAITLAELETCAIPAILIPFPYAAGDHQRKNAEETVHRGFASMIDESQLPQNDLLKLAVEELRSGMAQEKKELIQSYIAKKKPAVDLIAEDIIELLKAA
jgi:UDP-N-acetylglucosamine--N-acetylmuramyl-(pentapeptide) pyrophosphoryl-undecaprenol N-acetylglucosamine transferase